MKTFTGEWVPNDKMHPATNVFGRDWMSADGKYHGRYTGGQSIPLAAYAIGILWHFTSEQCENSTEQ